MNSGPAIPPSPAARKTPIFFGLPAQCGLFYCNMDNERGTDKAFSRKAIDEERFRREIADLKAKEKSLRTSTGKETEPGDQAGSNSRAMRYAGLGLEFASIFIGFVWAGRFLDERLGTKPWLVLVGICAGFGIALYRLIFIARRLSE